MIPKAQMILGYDEVYGNTLNESRINLIRHIPKLDLVGEIALINNRIKSKKSIFPDTSIELQHELLEKYSPNNQVYDHFISIFRRYSTDNGIKSVKNYPLFFTRQTCLFAMEEIISQNDLSSDVDGFVMGTEANWIAFLKYLAAVNTEITKIENTQEENPTLELFNVWTLALNELGIETDFLYTPYRGLRLLEYFISVENIRDEIIEYFRTQFGYEPDEFIFHILSMYYNSSSKDPSLDFYYLVDENSRKFFDILSKRITNTDIYKLINIRKYPFYFDAKNNGYVLMDSMVLIEKTYSQLINDFWFDWLKNKKDENGKSKYNISQYKSEVGYFVESYLREIFIDVFGSVPYTSLLLFDDLKMKEGKNQIEFADIYFRQGNKVLIGEVKSGAIYDNEKYSGDLDKFYKTNRDDFFENFGVNQLAESVIDLDKVNQIDPNYPLGRNKRIYPIIVVNDKVFQTPIMNDLFNKQFKSLIAGKVNLKKNQVYSLALIHVSDIEMMWSKIKNNPKLLWDALWKHSKQKDFTFPFYREVGRSFGYKIHPDILMPLYIDLIKKYSSE